VRSFWRWTGTIFFALAFLFLVPTGIGTSLPIDHHASCGASFDGPPRYLFAAIADDGTSIRWRPDIASAVLVSGSGPTAVWRETDVHGHAITYRTSVYSNGSKLARTIDLVPGMPFGGKWTFEISPDLKSPGNNPGARSYVVIYEDGLIYNPFFRFTARYVLGYTRGMRAYLEDLGRLKPINGPIVCEVNPGNFTSAR
jgi:hypothetical protein